MKDHSAPMRKDTGLSLPKKIFYVVAAALVLLCLWQYELLLYGMSQAEGQLKIVMNTRPVQEVMQDPTFPDSLKSKIELVQQIRQFAFDSLGLNSSENYTTVYNQQNKPVLWVVTACAPFQLKAKEWSFPLIGSFSYKGFFVLDKAKKEEQQLKAEGFDTSVDEVGGWSTLGWFKDPILTNMLNRSPGNLANLIIHELTHGTLYVKNNVGFNENLASFVGDKGAMKFLEFRYGARSEEYETYVKSRLASQTYTHLVLHYARKADSLYATFQPSTSVSQKIKEKNTLFTSFREELTEFVRSSGKYSRKKPLLGQLNNTYFMDMKRYRENLSVFEKEFIESFHGDFNRYMKYLKRKYPSL